jgi:rubrerythrin
LIPTHDVRGALHAARDEEKRQSLFYRALAAAAEAAGNEEQAERLNGLLADEQHHLSRLSARLLELGERLADLSVMKTPDVRYPGWEDTARSREAAEVDRYAALLEQPLDDATAAMVREFLEAERRHAAQLGGKWMPA